MINEFETSALNNHSNDNLFPPSLFSYVFDKNRQNQKQTESFLKNNPPNELLKNIHPKELPKRLKSSNTIQELNPVTFGTALFDVNEFLPSTDISRTTSFTDQTPKKNEDQILEKTASGHKGSYKKYSQAFKSEFIHLKLKHGLSIACVLKNVSVGTASKWVSKYNESGKDNMVDHRVNN